MQYLKADTITEVVVGPAVAVGDGFTPVTNLVGSAADEFEIIKHGATTTTTIAGTLAAVTGADGYYALDLSATDTNTEGRLTLLINDDSLILPIRMEFMVVNANVFDSLFAASGTDVLDVNLTQWLTTAPLALVSQRVDATSLIQDTAISTATFAAGAINAAAIATDAIGAAELATDAVAEIADAVWDEALAGHVGADSAGLVLNDWQDGGRLDLLLDDIPTTAEFDARTLVAASYFDPAADTVATVTTVTNQITAATMADAIWDEAIAGHLGAGSTGAALNAAGGAGDPWITALPGAYGAGTAGFILGTNLDAILTARTLVAASYFDPAADTVATVTTATNLTNLPAGAQASIDNIETDTNELQTVLSSGIDAETHNDTLIEQLQSLAAIIEHQRGGHTHQPIGDVFYVDPVNGATHASGARGGITDPYATIQDCHDNAITDSNHDMILLVSGAAAGATTHTVAATTTISKRYTFIRGPGRDFIWTRTGNGDTIAVTADGVEISGCQIGTAATGTGNGITVTSADFFKADRLWINDTQGHGIQLTDCDNAVIEDSHFHGTGQGGAGHGLVLDAAVGETGDSILVYRNHFHGVQGDCVRLNPTATGTVNDAVVTANHFINATGDGVDLTGANVNRASIYTNVFGTITGSDINDSGTDTLAANNEQWAKHSIATEARLAELDAANLPTDVDAILVDTADIQPKIGTPAADVSADIAAVKVDTAATLVDTNELQGDWTDSGRLDLLLDAIKVITDALGATAAGNLALSAGSQGIISATVDTVTNTHTPTTTEFQCDDITEATADHYNGRIVIFLTGVLEGQATDITDYAAVGGIGQFTVTALTEAPSNNDTLIVV